VIAYGSSYVLGSTVSYLILRRRLGGLETQALVRFLVRALVAAGVSTAIAWSVGHVMPGHTDDVSHVLAAVRVAVLGGIDLGMFLLLARLMRISEVTTIVETVVRRIPGVRAS
jgi:putative peptidoglycan lipid II flippase